MPAKQHVIMGATGLLSLTSFQSSVNQSILDMVAVSNTSVKKALIDNVRRRIEVLLI
jgi:hypothetical protein